MLFEYASYLKWGSARKVALAKYVAQVLPTTAGYGEGSPSWDTVPVTPPPPVQPPPPKENDDVTPQQIAEVLAGRDFERIATLLTLPGTDVAARRPAVHAWIRDRIVALDASYQQVFGRPVDLEGAGSRVLLALEGKTDAEIHQLLIRDKQTGAQ
jgi:hypothetical protein